MIEDQEDKMRELNDGLKTAYIDSSWNSNLAYRPEFIFLRERTFESSNSSQASVSGT